jgi:hypothetical protein
MGCSQGWRCKAERQAPLFRLAAMQQGRGQKMRHTEGKSIRLIVTDLDGTLLTSSGTLAPEGARLLKEAARDGKRVSAGNDS